MGRRRIVLTDNDKKLRIKSGERIKSLRKQAGYTQVKLAESLNISEPMLRNYEKGNYALPDDIATKMTDVLSEKGISVIPEYIQAITETTTREAYSIELEEIISTAESNYTQNEIDVMNRRKILFSELGYYYKYNEFSETPHSFIEKNNTSACFELDSAEYNNLMSSLSRTIRYAGYDSQLHTQPTHDSTYTHHTI